MRAKQLKYILFFLPFVCLSICAQQNEITLPEKTYTDTITIASEPDYPPFCIVNEEGEADGFSIDLFKAAAEVVNIKVDIKIGVWNKIKQDLAEGNIDALPLVGRTPERENVYDFTFPYRSLHGAVFVEKNTTGINTLKDLKNKKIAVMAGDNAEEFVRREKISNYIITTHTFEDAFQQLYSGNVDAVITQRVMGLRLLEKMDINSIEPLDLFLPNFRQDFCFAVKKGNNELLTRLNEGLSTVIANKTFDDIYLKWFGPGLEEGLSYYDVLKLFLYIFIPLFVVFSVAAIVILRRQVNKRTVNLHREIAEHKNTLRTLNYQQSLLKEMEQITKVGAWEYDVVSKKMTWTDGVYNIYGVSSSSFNPSEIEKNNITFYPPEDNEKLSKAFYLALNTGKPYNLELRVNAADGTSKWVKTIAHAEKENNRVVRLVGNIMDITEQKEARNELLKLKNELEIKVNERTKELREKVEKLNKSQKAMLYMVEDLNSITAELKSERKKLEASNKELEAFTYSVSHDLRAPLRAIDGFSRFLLEDFYDKLNDDGKRFIKLIRSSTVKMDNLISDLLNLSRISRAELRYSEINMSDMAESMFHEISTEEEKNQFDIHVDELPSVQGDPTLMKLVWQNLIGNSLKYSAKSKVKKIEIGFVQESKNITYFVKDYGAGFDDKYKDKLFGVFQRLHSEKEFEGTGVGLAIVQRIIHRHGGSIWAESQINKGAAFYFSLSQ